MALNFPNNPEVNDLYILGNSRWQWDGTAWNITVDQGDALATQDLTNVPVNAFRAKSVVSGLSTVVYNVTIAGPQASDTGNKYILNGVYRPILNFVAGYIYVFDQSDDTNVYWPNANNTTANPHPINFSADNLSGEVGGGTSYNTNVSYFLDNELVTQTVYYGATFNTASTRQVHITITNETPSTLYYWCWNHSAMGNEIAVIDLGTQFTSLATRQTEPTNAGIPFWNENENRFDNSSNATLDTSGSLVASSFTGSIDFSNLENSPTLVSGSSQVSFTDISDKPTLVSGSSQISLTDTDGFTSYSGSVSSTLETKVGRTSLTGSAIIPTGSEADRDLNPQPGFFRFNSDESKFEGYDGTEWGEIGGGEGVPLSASIDDTDSPFTITNQRIILADTTSGSITVNLPALSTIVGTIDQRPILIFKYDYSQNVIFVETNGVETINGKDRDILAGIQQAVIFHPTTEGWTVESQNGRSIAELAEFFVERENIVNDLTTGGATKVLSAEQGVELKDQLDAKGKVLQVVNSETDTEVIVSTTTYTDTTLTATITPKSATSDIQIFISQGAQIQRAADNGFGGIQLLRDSTVIHEPSGEDTNGPYSIGAAMYGSGAASMSFYSVISINYKDITRPESVDPITYKTQGRPYQATSNGLMRFQPPGGTHNAKSTMTLIEIEPNT